MATIITSRGRRMSKLRMGGLKRRGQIWWIRYYRNGRRYEESSRSARKSDAIDLLRVRLGDIAKGVPVTPALTRMRFGEAAADLLNDYTTNGRRSHDNVKRLIELALEPYFGGRRMASLSTSDVRAYIVARQADGAANATINRELAALKRMFSLAMQAQKLLHKPQIIGGIRHPR